MMIWWDGLVSGHRLELVLPQVSCLAYSGSEEALVLLEVQERGESRSRRLTGDGDLNDMSSCCIGASHDESRESNNFTLLGSPPNAQMFSCTHHNP